VRALLLALLAAVAVGARLDAADLSGRWIFTMDPDPRGNIASVECTLRQNGQALVVKCGSGTSEMKGEVNGKRVGFRNPPAEAETASGFILSFDGQIGAGATTLKGTWRAVFVRLSETRDGKFRARRKR
jgi:hypothetical protein